MNVESAKSDTSASADFFEAAAKELAGLEGDLTVLDFGCGAGELVEELTARGWRTFGCDLPGVASLSDRIRAVGLARYRLPFDDDVLDLVGAVGPPRSSQRVPEGDVVA